MNYPGGKGASFRQIVNLMPPHRVYIEPFLGGGNVMLRKRPASTNIGIDVDGSVIAAWRDKRSFLAFPVELHHGDAIEFLTSYNFKGGELVYCDPPYLPSTCRTRCRYRYGYTETQHVSLLELLVKLPCPVILSGYPSPLYRNLLQQRHGWRAIEYPATTRGGRVIESAWYNFEPIALHDCRYVGVTFRERERIKRKRDRWRAKFERMESAERQVVLGALLELESPVPTMRTASPDLTIPPARGSHRRGRRGAPADIAGTDDARASSGMARR